jgi:hypothetical protein
VKSISVFLTRQIDKRGRATLCRLWMQRFARLTVDKTFWNFRIFLPKLGAGFTTMARKLVYDPSIVPENRYE